MEHRNGAGPGSVGTSNQGESGAENNSSVITEDTRTLKAHGAALATHGAPVGSKEEVSQHKPLPPKKAMIYRQADWL